MFQGLRHHAVVSRHYQKCDVDAAGAGKHGVHETLVTGHIDEAEDGAVVQRQIGEAQVDGDAA